MQKYQIEIYETPDGKRPYSEWLKALKDIGARARIRTRIDRVSLGNFGRTESVGSGVYELKLDFGPGYRVYYGLEKEEKKIILLLLGGTKKKQQKDINQSIEYWKQAKAEKRREKNAKKKLPR